MATAPNIRKARGRIAPSCLDVESWRAFTPEEHSRWLTDVYDRGNNGRQHRRPSSLAVRRSLSPVDVYCYLKARFGDPSGFQTLLRKDDSDNWIHWDFKLKAGEADVYICGTSREVHFTLSEKMKDEDWLRLISAIKGDFVRVGSQKTAILKSLEKWVVFPNRFVEVATICADLHSDILANIGGFQVYRVPSKRRRGEQEWALRQLAQRSSKLHRSSLELSLLTPVMAEAFINVVVLMLCKREIRENSRQFNDFIRSSIDTKLFDLSYKCHGFQRPIDRHAEIYKQFKRVMDKRNHKIHGDCDPKNEQVETVYFEGTLPLFVEPGDHVGKFFEALERQYRPQEVIKDYEDTHKFLIHIADNLEPHLVEAFRRIIEHNYPGYDVGRQKMGVLFPEYVAMCSMQGMKYDDELNPEKDKA